MSLTEDHLRKISERTARRKRGRELAEILLSMLDVEDREPRTAEAMLHAIREALLPDAVRKEAEERIDAEMEDRRRYESVRGWTLPFGKHAGMRLDECPSEYVEWLGGSMDEQYGVIQDFLRLRLRFVS